jgi:hypothetical protein
MSHLFWSAVKWNDLVLIIETFLLFVAIHARNKNLRHKYNDVCKRMGNVMYVRYVVTVLFILCLFPNLIHIRLYRQTAFEFSILIILAVISPLWLIPNWPPPRNKRRKKKRLPAVSMRELWEKMGSLRSLPLPQTTATIISMYTYVHAFLRQLTHNQLAITVKWYFLVPVCPPNSFSPPVG